MRMGRASIYELCQTIHSRGLPLRSLARFRGVDATYVRAANGNRARHDFPRPGPSSRSKIALCCGPLLRGGRAGA